MHSYFSWSHGCTIAWARDYRLHRKRRERMCVFRLYGLARLHRLIWKAVGRAHEISGEFVFQQFNFGEPFAGGRSNPARNQGTGGKAVMLGQRSSIHVRGNERIGVKSLLYRNAANERRNFTGDFVEAAEHYMLAGGLHSSPNEHIATTRTVHASA